MFEKVLPKDLNRNDIIKMSPMLREVYRVSHMELEDNDDQVVAKQHIEVTNVDSGRAMIFFVPIDAPVWRQV